MSNMNSQISAYKLEYSRFLDEIDDGTFDGKLNSIQAFQRLTIDEQREISKQIRAYKANNPTGSFPGFVKFAGKTAVNSFLGPLGFSVQDIQNPQRIASRLKDTAIRSAQNVILRNIRNPSSFVIKFDKAKNRVISDEEKKYDDLVEDWRKAKLDNKNLFENFTKNKEAKNEIAKTIDQFNSNESLFGHERDEKTYSEINEQYLIKFHLTNDDKVIIFRMANFTGLTDSINVSYDDNKYIGRPEALPSYNSVSRTISFTFSVYRMEANDLIYTRLNRLQGLAYPNTYTETNIIQPNIVKLSIGNYLNKVPFFMESLTYTSDDDLVYSDGRPRAINVSVTGRIVNNVTNPTVYSQHITDGVPITVKKQVAEKRQENKIFQEFEKFDNSSVLSPNLNNIRPVLV